MLDNYIATEARCAHTLIHVTNTIYMQSLRSQSSCLMSLTLVLVCRFSGSMRKVIVIHQGEFSDEAGEAKKPIGSMIHCASPRRLRLHSNRRQADT
jgi:hypothetical protein